MIRFRERDHRVLGAGGLTQQLGELAGFAVTEEKQAALQAIVSPLSILEIERNGLVQVEL